MDLPERTAESSAPETLEQDWRQLRDLLGGDDRECVRALTGRIAHLEAQLLISQDRRKAAWNSPRRLRPLVTAAAAIVLLAAGHHHWQRSRVARAVAALEEIPGLVILESRAGNATIKGLRDPLGPEPAAVLSERGIDASRFRLTFASIPSLETPWAEQRGREQARQLEATRQDFVTVVGDLDSARETMRRRDLQSLTTAIFHLKFPKAAGQAEIVLENDQWKLRGNVTESLHHQILAEIPLLGLSGEIDASEFRVATPQALLRLKEAIESITLVYLAGGVELSTDGHHQSERLTRLLKQHDDLSSRLDEMPASIEVHSRPAKGQSETNEALERERIARTRHLIAESAGLSAFRLVPGVRDEPIEEGRVGVYVRLLPHTGSQP